MTQNYDFSVSSAQTITTEAQVIILVLFPEEHPLLRHLVEEFTELSQIIEKRYAIRHLEYPTNFAIEMQSSFFLYALIRLIKPETVVETGVANGQSTFFILHALIKNQKGYLHSFDISTNVGILIDSNEKGPWFLHNLESTENIQNSFISILNHLPNIDIFLHDSDHSYDWQYFEYNTILPKLSPNGVIASDDIHWTNAFYDFCRNISVKPFVLVETTKKFGIVFPNQKTNLTFDSPSSLNNPSTKKEKTKKKSYEKIRKKQLKKVANKNIQRKRYLQKVKQAKNQIRKNRIKRTKGKSKNQSIRRKARK